MIQLLRLTPVQTRVDSLSPVSLPGGDLQQISERRREFTGQHSGVARHDGFVPHHHFHPL